MLKLYIHSSWFFADSPVEPEKVAKRKRDSECDSTEKSESEITDTQSESDFDPDEPPSKRKRGKTLKKTLPKNRQTNNQR